MTSMTCVRCGTVYPNGLATQVSTMIGQPAQGVTGSGLTIVTANIKDCNICGASTGCWV